MPRPRVIAVAASMLLGCVAALLGPSSNPRVIHARVAILGAPRVYRTLVCCFGDQHQRWDDVIRGVRSGDPAWLQVAVDLKPSLDTHPGEEMVTAVAAALEANPEAVLDILAPAYGTDLVCGGEWSEERIDSTRAAARLRTLESLTKPAARLEHCRGALHRIVEKKRSPEA